MTPDWTENDLLFRRKLQDGVRWEKTAKAWLEALGFPVVHYQHPFREQYSSEGPTALGVDFRIKGVRIEFKARDSVRFTKPSDFPFDDVIVCTDRKLTLHEQRGVTPDLFLYVCTQTRAYIALPAERIRRPWRTKFLADSVRGIQQVFAVESKTKCLSGDEVSGWIQSSPRYR